MKTIQQVLETATKQLIDAGVRSPQLDARLIFCYVLGCEVEHLVGYPEEEVSEEKSAEFFELIERRMNKEPVAKIIGKKEFWGREFFVNQHVLDPRPDSETLIEAVLEYFSSTNKLKILDIGTGSGCLLLTLINEYPESSGLGVDISPDALAVAEKNNNNDRCKFKQSDLLANVDDKFDIIISNPPYIKTSNINELDDDVSVHDPYLALDGGNDGLECYRCLIPKLRPHLNAGGKVFVEIGEGQEKEVSQIFEDSGFQVIEMKKDLAGIIRCLVAI